MQHDIACISETTYYIVCLPFYLSSFEQWGVVGIVLVWQNQNRNLVRLICAGGVSLLCLIFSMIMKHWNFSNPEEFKGKTNKLLPFSSKWFDDFIEGNLVDSIHLKFSISNRRTQNTTQIHSKIEFVRFCIDWTMWLYTDQSVFLCVCVYNIYVVVYSWFTDEIKS